MESPGFCSPWPFTPSPEKSGSFLFTQQAPRLLLLPLQMLFFFLCFLYKDFRIWTLYLSMVFCCLFVCLFWTLTCTKKFWVWPVLVHTCIQLKHVSWNLAICSLSTMYLDLSTVFLFEEKCLSGDPMYWFPIRDQQPRTQCILAFYHSPWISARECLKALCTSPCHPEAPRCHGAVCWRGV